MKVKEWIVSVILWMSKCKGDIYCLLCCPHLCVCPSGRTWWAEERSTKTWRERPRRSVRNTAKWSSVSFLRWVARSTGLEPHVVEIVDVTRDDHKPSSSPQIADVPDDEAVRIFLEFERVESAIKGQCLLIVSLPNPEPGSLYWSWTPLSLRRHSASLTSRGRHCHHLLHPAFVSWAIRENKHSIPTVQGLYVPFLMREAAVTVFGPL